MNTLRRILFSNEKINPSPNSLFLPVPQWGNLSFASISADGILSEDATSNVHAVVRDSPTFFALQNNIPYRWTVWVRPLARRFVYLSIVPGSGGGIRVVTVWGLDGQGLLETRLGINPINVSTSYKRIASGIYKLTINFTITSGALNQIPVIGIVDKFPPTYNAGGTDVTFQGLNQPSLQILANELLPA